MTPASKAAAAAEAQRRRQVRRRLYFRRQMLALAIALGLLAPSLGVGMWGYRHFENESWRDALLNAAMLLSGEGPIQQELSRPGKVFAGLYALYSGLIVIAVAGLILAPGVHHLMKVVHVEGSSDEE